MVRTVLKNCILIDGEGNDPFHDGVLVVDAGRVEWTGSVEAWEGEGPGDCVIDMKGSYVLPGLWDMHLHLAYRDLKDVSVAATVPSDAMFSTGCP